MKKFFLLSLVSSLVYSQDYWCLDKRLTIEADYGYFRRQEIRDLRLLEDTSSYKNDKPRKRLDTDDLVEQFHSKSALRGSLTYHGEDQGSLQALYTFFFPWEAEIEKSAGGTLQFPFKDPSISFDFQKADEATTWYNSWLQNGEFNYWGHITPQRVNYFSFSWNLGLRMLFLNEKFRMSFQRGNESSDYIIKTKNHLYGPQLGAMLEINPSHSWTWSFLVKGAGFLNDAKNKLKIEDMGNSRLLREYSKKSWAGSWLLEGYAQLAFHWFSWLSFEVAYQGFILTGLALAPEQRDIHSTDKRRIHTEGQIVIDGFLAGISLSF